MPEKVTIDKTDLQSRDRKLNEQQEEIRKLKEQLESLESSSNSNNSAGFTLSKEDQESLGDLYEPVKKLVEASLGGFSKNVENNFNKVTKSLSSLENNIKSQNKSLFSGVASSTLKNFSSVKGTEEFKDFMESEVEGVGIQWKDAWANAEDNNDIRRMQQIVDKVHGIIKTKSGQDSDHNVSEQKEAEDEERNYEPTGGSRSNGVDFSTRFTYKASDLAKKTALYKQGKIRVEELEKFEEKFYNAVDKGQVMNDLEEE